MEEALALYEKAIVQLRRNEIEDIHSPLQLKLFSNAALCHLTLRNYQVIILSTDYAVHVAESRNFVQIFLVSVFRRLWLIVTRFFLSTKAI